MVGFHTIFCVCVGSYLSWNTTQFSSRWLGLPCLLLGGLCLFAHSPPICSTMNYNVVVSYLNPTTLPTYTWSCSYAVYLVILNLLCYLANSCHKNTQGTQEQHKICSITKYRYWKVFILKKYTKFTMDNTMAGSTTLYIHPLTTNNFHLGRPATHF